MCWNRSSLYILGPHTTVCHSVRRGRLRLGACVLSHETCTYMHMHMHMHMDMDMDMDMHMSMHMQAWKLQVLPAFSVADGAVLECNFGITDYVSMPAGFQEAVVHVTSYE